jgi:ABC-type dipeptide/oligopeptide/nickel transport system permease component
VARYVLGRVLQILPVLIGVSMVVFLLVRLIPGDPAVSMLGGRATPQLLKAAREQLHLNEPIWTQYYDYVRGWVHGQFGVSFFYGSSVWSLTLPRVPATLELIGYAALLALLITLPLASIAALYRGRLADQLVRIFFSTALGIPSFWLGLLLALYLGVRTKVFPIAGTGSGVVGTIYHLTLPALTIALSMSPLLVRALRSSLIEVLTSDYVTTARAAGVRVRHVFWSYLLRNSVLPLITVLSINLGFLIGGTVIVEQIYAIPGLGSLLIGSIATRDYAIIQLITLILALFVLVTNLLTDLAYVAFDPRIDLRA